MASKDPDFERKAFHLIGLYLNPPQHAAVFCVDDKSAIQALDRLDPVLPMSPGRADRHEYYPHGTLSPYAALDVKTSKVHGKTAARHTSDEFVAFLQQVTSQCKRKQQIHIILDICPRTRTAKVEEFLQQFPKRTAALHAHLLFLAQPSRNLVCPRRTRGDRPRSLYFCERPRSQTHALHPRILRSRETLFLKYSNVNRRIHTKQLHATTR